MRDLLGGPKPHRARSRRASIQSSVALAPSKSASPDHPRYPPGAETALSRFSSRRCRRSATGPSMFSRRDVDDFDRLCDHLLVLDHGASTKPCRSHKPKVVGTYRLLRQDVAERTMGLLHGGRIRYRAHAPAPSATCGFLELGRSCVLKPYRNKRTVELLWHGIWTYVLHHRIDVMIGCASLEGTDPRAVFAALELPASFRARVRRLAGLAPCRSTARRWTFCRRKRSTRRRRFAPCRR